MRRFLLLLLLVGAKSLDAQVLPPDFLCVRNDTLFWEPATNFCGPFESYLVFGSNSADGPYSLLATISDFSQTTFYNPDGPGQEWHYYLESNYDCPGLQAFPSDTLDNLIPLIGPIDFVTVDGDGVDLQWSDSPSPEVFAYIIARNTDFGTEDIDTVFAGNTYTDLSAAPQDQSETYFVIAMDRCGNRSLVDLPHETLFLEVTNLDPCERTIAMTWNAYINWPEGVERYEILVSENGMPFELAGQVDGSTTTYVFEGVQDMSNYCFMVEAIAMGSGYRSLSSEACQDADIVQPLTDFRFDNATINLDGSTALRWRWATDAELSDATLQQSMDGVSFNMVPAYSFGGNGSQIAQFSLPDPTANIQATSFRVEAVDDCGIIYTSNAVRTIFLSATLNDDQSTSLWWSAFENDSASIRGYSVFQLRNGLSVLVDEVGPGVLQYDIPFNPVDPTQFSTCYYVVADFELPGAEMLESQSNVVCVEQESELFVPNAFVPDGVNRLFKPILQFGSPAEYSMEIWDRWGQRLFVTDDFGVGWNGMVGGNPASQGTYVYTIRLTRTNGTEIVKQGMVTLLR